MADRVMRWTVLATLALATGVMFLVSLRGNFLYGYALGQSDEKRFLFGWANVAADLWKGFGLVAVTLLWRDRRVFVAAAGALAWVICLCSGLNSAIGVFVQDRAALTGEREARHRTYRDAQAELDRLLEHRSRLAPHRSIPELDALIAGAHARPVIIGQRVRGTLSSVSEDCKRIDTRTVVGCGELAALRSERAVALAARELEAQTERARDEVTRLRERGHTVAPDPVGQFYEWATRGLLSVRDIGFGFPLFFAVMIEIVTAFGLVAVVHFGELCGKRPTASSRVVSEPAIARHGASGPALSYTVGSGGENVALWMAQCARPSTNSGSLAPEHLYEHYRRWCERERQALGFAEFITEFDRLREMPELYRKIRKGPDGYYGLELGHGSP